MTVNAMIIQLINTTERQLEIDYNFERDLLEQDRSGNSPILREF